MTQLLVPHQAKQLSQLCKPALRAVHMGLFPTAGSLQEVVDLAESKLPITTQNDVFCLLMTYHNTILKLIK